MKQEDKEILLKDLCERLPYNTMVSVAEGGINGIEWNKAELNFFLLHQIEEEDAWEFVKPYLRPMPSMTEEEKEELKNLFDAEEVTSYSICYIEGGTLVEYLSPIPYSFCYKIIDWLNKNMFDYRGLIPKGLAIAVTKENNPYKD